MEDRFFFESEGTHCYAVLHTPEGEQGQRGERQGRVGVVLAHPLLDFDLYEVPWTIRMVTGYARELARAGYTALRFDFRGVGSSEGAHDGGRGEVEDLAACVAWIRGIAGGTPVLTVGYSFGSWCALRHAARSEPLTVSAGMRRLAAANALGSAGVTLDWVDVDTAADRALAEQLSSSLATTRELPVT